MGHNSAKGRRYGKRLIGAFALTVLAFGAGSARAAVVTTCTDCHGMPPTDAVRKGNPHFRSMSSAVLGNHQTHVKPSPAPSDCNVCHQPVAATNFGHQNGVIAMANSLKGYSTATLRAKYNKGVFVNQTSVPNLTAATCSNVNCHFESVTPAWGTSPTWSATGATATTCGACHGAPPAGTTSAPGGGLAGSHSRHNVYYPGITNCQKCHPATTGFSHATSAGRPLKVQGYLRNPGNTLTAGATYSGTATNYLPSKSATPGFGSCSNTYCHSNGTGATLQSGDTRGIAANTSLTWGTTGGSNFATNCSTTCHNGRPSYPNYTGLTPVTGQKANSHQATTHAQQTCDVCHASVATTDGGVTYTTYTSHVNGRYNLKASLGYSYGVRGGTCATPGCHGSAQWGVTVMNCVSCHSSAVNITHGPLVGQTRRAIQPEFTQTWSHKASGGRTVVPADCIVCHMEGDKTTGKTTTQHGDGFVNLRDPDTGVEITNVTWNGATPGSFVTAAGNASFSRFSRDFSVPLESDPSFLTLAAVEVNHCLKCHDADGALSANAQVPTTGTAGRPFGYAVGSTSTNSFSVAAGNTTSNVVNVASSFATTNSSYHPVLGKQNNGFAGGARMKAPWNGTLNPAKPGGASTTVYGFLISCWDCHRGDTDAAGNTTVQTSTVTAHGNANTVWADPSIAYPNLCTKCHADAYGTTSGQHGTGSGFASTGGAGDISSRAFTCANCHSSFNLYRPWRGVDAHGFNAMSQVRADTTSPANSATWSTGAKPWAFIRTNNLGGWRPAKGAGLTDATNGTCSISSSPGSCNNSHGTYTPGGYY